MDACSIYDNLSPIAISRTSLENVFDVLESISKLENMESRNSDFLERVSSIMRSVDAYAYDYKTHGKLAPSRENLLNLIKKELIVKV